MKTLAIFYINPTTQRGGSLDPASSDDEDMEEEAVLELIDEGH
jgi:hypothetical protein